MTKLRRFRLRGRRKLLHLSLIGFGDDRGASVHVETGSRLAPIEVEGWRLLGITVIAQATHSVVEQGIPLLVGFIRLDLGVSATVAGVAVSSFALGKILGSWFAGVAADSVGERLVLVAAGLIGAAFVLAAAPLPPPLVFLLLIFAGVASAAVTPASGRLVTLAFPRQRYGVALGIRQTGVPLGGLIAAAMLPWIAQAWSWRWSLSAAAVIMGLGVVPLVLPSTGRLGTAFTDSYLHEPKAVVGKGAIGLLTVWGCLLVSGELVVLTFLGPDLHERMGLSLATASLFVAFALAASIAGRLGWGIVSDVTRPLGRKWLLLVLTALGVTSSLLLFAIPESTPVGVVLLAAALAGLTLNGYQAVWWAMVAEAAGPSRVGAATGFVVTFLYVAIAITPPLFGAVADVAGTYRAVWGALAVVLSLALVPAALVKEQRVEA